MRLLRAAVVLFLVAGCGGSSEPTPPPAPPPPPPPPPAPAPVGSVLLSPTSATLVPQQTLPIAATVLDATGSLLTGRTVTWSSSAAAVASVSSSGLVTALTAGTAPIIATSEGKSSTATITVNDGLFVGPAGGQTTAGSGSVTLTIPPQALTTNTAIGIAFFAAPPDPKFVSGTAYQFGPDGTQFAQPVTIRIHYTTAQAAGLDPSLFRLGRLVGNTWTELPGSSVEVATQSVTGQTSSFSIYGIVLAAAPVATVTVAPPSSSLSIGGTVQLTATLRDAAQNVLVDRSVAWTSSNPSVASVGPGTGLVTANAVGGPVTITATSETINGTAQVTVSAPVQTVTVAPTPSTLQIGETLQLSATLRDAGNNILSDRPVTWASTDVAIATVSSTGLVTALSSGGPITITATSEGKVGAAQVTVASAPVASVDLIGPTRVKVGDNYLFSAVARDAQGNELAKMITWSILETGKGTMSSAGLLVPSQTGTITIRMVIDGVNWDRAITAYDWVTNGLTLTLPADNEVSNQSGVSELPILNISCSGGTFQVWVSTTGFITASGVVQYTIDSGGKITETWVQIDANHSLRYPGATNAAQKTFAQSLASAHLFGWLFTEAGAGGHGVSFRVTGLNAILGPVTAGCP